MKALKLSLLAVTCGAFLVSCGQEQNSDFAEIPSGLGDIYKADNDPARRHKATGAEILWTVNVKGGCSGSMLTPTIMLTANHCGPRVRDNYTSGSALKARGRRWDMTVTEVLEASRRYDYQILRVKWNNSSKTMPSDQKLPQGIITDVSQAVLSESADQGDEAFTVGFPVDKSSWGATFAKGRLKAISGTNMKYNIGSINGNSGGAVWRMSDMMIVSLTNNGPHNHGQPGWNNNDKNNPRAWNWGANMAEVYQQSKVFKEIFPDGKNPHYKGDKAQD